MAKYPSHQPKSLSILREYDIVNPVHGSLQDPFLIGRDPATPRASLVSSAILLLPSTTVFFIALSTVYIKRRGGSFRLQKETHIKKRGRRPLTQTHLVCKRFFFSLSYTETLMTFLSLFLITYSYVIAGVLQMCGNPIGKRASPRLLSDLRNSSRTTDREEQLKTQSSPT